MNFKLKTLSPEAVARCLAKAERYRLLNEPGEAQSICLDVLASEPGNQDALATLLLALTERLSRRTFVADAWPSSRGCAATTRGRSRESFQRRAKASVYTDPRLRPLCRLSCRRAGTRPGRSSTWQRDALLRWPCFSSCDPDPDE
jgi:hypothetical protein